MAEAQSRLAEYLTVRTLSFSTNSVGYLPFAQAGGQLLFHLVSHLYKRTSGIVTILRDRKKIVDELTNVKRASGVRADPADVIKPTRPKEESLL